MGLSTLQLERAFRLAYGQKHYWAEALLKKYPGALQRTWTFEELLAAIPFDMFGVYPHMQDDCLVYVAQQLEPVSWIVRPNGRVAFSIWYIEGLYDYERESIVEGLVFRDGSLVLELVAPQRWAGRYREVLRSFLQCLMPHLEVELALASLPCTRP